MRIAVEDRRDPRINYFLNEVALSLSKKHSVYRFYTRFSQYERKRTQLENDTDLVFLWNGEHPTLKKTKDKILKNKSKIIFLELGMIDQEKTIQIDYSGINYNCSWKDFKIPDLTYNPICISGKNDILVILQCDNDAQIRNHSPIFKNMFEFVDFLSTIKFKYTVRPHPRSKLDNRIVKISNNHNIEIRKKEDLNSEILNHKIICTINSTVGFQSIVKNKPVISFGDAIYNRDQVCYNIKDVNRFEDLVVNLLKGDCSLCKNKQDFFINYVANKQIKISETDKILDYVECL